MSQLWIHHTTTNCTSEIKCYHCHQDHQTENKSCIEYRYELEILSIQSKSIISKPQAKLVLDREKSNFRTMNFANATRQNLNLPFSPPPPSIPIAPSIASSSKIPKATSSKSILPRKTTTDTVGKAPKNQTINASRPHSDALDSDDLTSQNNPVLRSEARRIFDAFNLEVNSVEEDDVSAYADEVKQSLNRKHSYPKDNEKTPIHKKKMGECLKTLHLNLKTKRSRKTLSKNEYIYSSMEPRTSRIPGRPTPV